MKQLLKKIKYFSQKKKNKVNILEKKFYRRRNKRPEPITLFLLYISFKQFSPLVFLCAIYTALMKINWAYLANEMLCVRTRK